MHSTQGYIIFAGKIKFIFMISRRLLRIKALKALYAHLKSESDSLMASEKTLVASINKTYDLYFQMLSLIVEVARYADERQQAAMQKKLPTYEDLNPNRKFVENAVVHLIAESDSVNDYLAAHKLSWARYPELIKALYGLKECGLGIVGHIADLPAQNSCYCTVCKEFLCTSNQFLHLRSPNLTFSPRPLILATKSFIVSENLTPSAADTHSTRVRPFSTPM